MEWIRVWQHIQIVLLAAIFTVIFGLVLGFISHLNKKVGKVILTIVDVLQTVPTLAMLGILMSFLGAGRTTVVVGLVLYSLLPVVRNTCTGLDNVNPAVKEAALGMGMSKTYRLFRVELPIAFPTIFTGIRIAVVTSISVAVFGALVGGGGLGKVIYRAIYIQNMPRLLLATGCLMLMAIVFDSLMSVIEKQLYKHQM